MRRFLIWSGRIVAIVLVVAIAESVGTVSSGKQADLVVVNGNPAADISDIRRVEFVVRKGVAYDPAKLLEGIDGVVGVEN